MIEFLHELPNSGKRKTEVYATVGGDHGYCFLFGISETKELAVKNTKELLKDGYSVSSILKLEINLLEEYDTDSICDELREELGIKD